MTYLMPGTVSEVSATLVASTMRRFAPEGWKICAVRRATGARTGAGFSSLRRSVDLRRASAASADFAFARQEHQNIAFAVACQFVGRIDNRVGQLDFCVIFVFAGQRSVEDFDGIGATAYF